MIEYKKIIDKRLIELFNKKDLPYQILIDAALYAVDTTAKRIRPLLILSCVKSYDQDISIAIDPACAIELVHTYSLIHDDLPCMDDDDFRRGKPTLHKKYPEWVAVLTGDYLLNYAFEIVLNIKNLSEKQILELARTLSKNSCNLLAGQTVDLVSENKKIDFETLNFMHLNKTASLFVAAIDFAAIILNLDSKKRENLNIFAKKLGFIFQIQDDILDNQSVDNSDEILKKSTYISILGLEKSNTVLSNLKQECLNLLKDLNLKKNYLNDLTLKIFERTS